MSNPMTFRVHHISRSADTAPSVALPSPSDDAAWTAETVAIIAGVPMPPHTMIHTRPQAGCPLCPPTACPCGRFDCPDVFEHRRSFAGSETTWREVAA
ncbi:hypothetical protein [Verrucosispora sp. NA02020]|uniref:hypothetical protein n=1 Tax=Verrucosispora sp. NA02020 TaxID=2742132 RepID=UPI00158FF41F|nr:hypothetical protein [Verrucosispora sp. NA02020]QKW15309.1 hypothetical protein HUT12_22820 [Verrucosispora sp. NA02020]